MQHPDGSEGVSNKGRTGPTGPERLILIPASTDYRGRYYLDQACKVHRQPG